MIERRKEPRTDAAFPVYIVCVDENGRETAQDVATIVNISKSGVLLESAIPILTKEIRILASVNKQEKVQVVAELIYSMQLAPDQIRSGLSFRGDSDQIRRFVDGLRNTVVDD